MRAQVYVSKQGMCDNNKVVNQPTLAHYFGLYSGCPCGGSGSDTKALSSPC